MRIVQSVCAPLAAALLAACSTLGYAPPPSPAATVDGVLTGSQGMTLYTFDRDAVGSGKSVCNGTCATNWPPLFAAEGDAPRGDFSVVVRDDGRRQWAFKGKPLYYWVKDQKPGDRTGDGVGNAWRLARP